VKSQSEAKSQTETKSQSVFLIQTRPQAVQSEISTINEISSHPFQMYPTHHLAYLFGLIREYCGLDSAADIICVWINASTNIMTHGQIAWADDNDYNSTR